MVRRLTAIVSLVLLVGCSSWREDGSPGPAMWWDAMPLTEQALAAHAPRRHNAASPWFTVSEDDLDLQCSWCGWDIERNRRIEHLNIHPRAKGMIERADRCIIASVFLFDNLYGPEPPRWDIVGEYTDLLVEKKRRHPGMPIVIVLDLMHKAWSDRESPAVERLHAAGIDVFYSDRLDTKSATRMPIYEGPAEAWRRLNGLTGGTAGRVTEPVGKSPIPLLFYRFDGEPIRLETIFNAAILKANHRKLLITAHGDQWEALVTSANPHNASIPNENYGITVKGAPAAYLYMVQRADVKRSIERGPNHCHWADGSEAYRRAFLDEQLPALPEDVYMPAGGPGGDEQPRVMIATEEQIEAGVLAMLERVGPDDQVRIQMFYLSRLPVINALLDAAGRTRQPVRLLLDPNRVGINYAKNGTPNAQVAEYLLQRARIEGLNLQVRWYATHGEQNHAKIMSVTNHATGKYEITTGSANWTRKNLDNINLEANLFVIGSLKLNQKFDSLFDRLWYNSDPGIEYSIAWDDPRHIYHKHVGRSRWSSTPKLLIFPFHRPDGRPVLIENELVHW